MLVKHLRGSIRKPTAHIATNVYCILKGNALVTDKNSSFEILKDWQIFILSPN